MKTAFLFPGQGSQKVGMVQDLCEKYDSVKALIKEADETLGFSISKMMFEGPDTELMKTEFTQPAILTASVAVWQVLKEHGLTPDIAAGHSLGEYSALVAAGAISFADAVHTVHLRGRFMQEAVPLGEGGMAAVIGSTPETIVKVCGEVSTEDLPRSGGQFQLPGAGRHRWRYGSSRESLRSTERSRSSPCHHAEGQRAIPFHPDGTGRSSTERSA